MDRPHTVNISDVIDNRPVGSFQIGLFLICAACLILDGFDVQATGYVGAALTKDLGLSGSQFSAVASAGLIGILLGALLFGWLGDRFGRRPVLIAATLAFSVLTLLTGFSQSLMHLVVLRLLAGIGLGGIMPNVVALVGEYSPARSRAFLMMFISNGFNVGAVLGGFASRELIPDYGWRAVFYFGGIVPIAIALLMYFGLPESLQFLALRGGKDATLRKWLAKIDPTVALSPSTKYVTNESHKEGVPVGRLFEDGRAAGTVLLWLINFMNLVNLYFLSQWLPRVFVDIGYSQEKAIWIGTTLQIGGAIGTLILGWFIGRYGYTRVLTWSFALGVLAVAAIGQQLSIEVLFGVVFVAGFCIVGGQAGLNALAATFYPTDLRSTGVGYALGIGRIGGIVAQPVAGGLIDRGWMARQLLLAAALPATVTVMGLVGMGKQLKKVKQRASSKAPTERT
jgi:AAHS family 4-hydroxybenzoate transporter-like MFS transporter